jgi:two-component system, LytTR family, response regulator
MTEHSAKIGERPAKIRALLVDDEPLARSNLKFLLLRDPDIEAIAEAGSGAEAVAEIRGTRPDLVFLDVQMPECGGFEVLEILKGDVALPVIVFVTAFDEYALRAFDAGALDYLLKPFDDARFALAMQRAKEKLAAREPVAAPEVPRLTVRSAGMRSMCEYATSIGWKRQIIMCACTWVQSRTCCAGAWPSWNGSWIRIFFAASIARPSSIFAGFARFKPTVRANTR